MIQNVFYRRRRGWPEHETTEMNRWNNGMNMSRGKKLSPHDVRFLSSFDQKFVE